jgi:hypothetical protein
MEFHFSFMHDFSQRRIIIPAPLSPSNNLLLADNLSAAVNLGVRLGWKLFPAFCSPSRLARSLDERIGDSTNNLEQILAFAAMQPVHWRALLGPAPSGSGITVLDIEGQPGRDSLLTIREDDWEFLQTLQYKSQAGGTLHCFFDWPANMAPRYLGRIRGGLRVLGSGDSIALPGPDCPGPSESFVDPAARVLTVPAWFIELGLFERTRAP